MMEELASTVVELSNKVKNIEVTTAKIRIDLAKQLDLSSTTAAIPYNISTSSICCVTTGLTAKDEQNMDAFISAVSEKKTMISDQEMIIRNMLMVKDKEIID